MPACSYGHDSASPDYCDVCGTPMTAAVPASESPSSTAPVGETCSRCGTPRTGRYCEACGYDFSPDPTEPPSSGTTSPAAPADWIAVVAVDPAAEAPPAYCPERTFVLDRPQMRIGRSSRSRGISPEIDLTGPPPDEGVSHLHAVLIAQPDGAWQLIDPGSTNGTRLNTAADDVAIGVPVDIADGDTIHIGAWTMITIRRAS